MLPMMIAARGNQDGGEIPPTMEERTRRSNTIRMFLVLIFVLVFVDISSVPIQKPDAAGATSSAADGGADGKAAGGAGGGNPTIAEKFTSKINQLTAAPAYRRENLPHNVTGLYRGEWSSPNHKFQSGILPARPSTKPKTQASSRDNAAATRALKPAAGRMLLTLRSTAIPDLHDITFVFGIARLFGGGIGDTDSVVPLKGLFVASSGELALVTSYDPNERLYLEVPMGAGAGANRSSNTASSAGTTKGGSRRVLLDEESYHRHLSSDSPGGSETTSSAAPVTMQHVFDIEGGTDAATTAAAAAAAASRRSARSSSQPPPSGPQLLGRGMRNLMAAAFAGGGRAGDGAADAPYSEERERARELLHFSMESTLQELREREGEGEVAHDSDHRDHRRRLDTAGKSLGSSSGSSKNESAASFSLLVGSVRLGGTPVRLLLTQNIVAVLSASRTNDTTTTADNKESHRGGQNSSTIAAALSRNFHVKDNSVVGELGRNDVSGAFKSIQSIILNSALKSGAPLCPTFYKFSVDSLLGNGKDRTTGGTGLLQDGNLPSDQGTAPAAVGEEGGAGGADTFAAGIHGSAASSPCGLNMTLDAASYHLDAATLQRKTSIYSVFATFVCIAQVTSLIMQMRYAQTQAIAARMSILSLSLNGVLDALMSVGHLMLSAAVPGVFLQHFMWISILKLVYFCVFEMRMIVAVYQARYADEAADEGWGGLRRRLGTLHLRFYASVFAGMFLCSSLVGQPVYLVFLLYSMWLPQIAFNAYNGTRKALAPTYLYTTTASRLFIPLYFYGCPDNFMQYIMVEQSMPPTTHAAGACFLLVFWLGAQVLLLVLQDRLGPRFFLPRSWFPQVYDYYRPIPASAFEEQALPVAATTGGSSSSMMMHDDPAQDSSLSHIEGGQAPRLLPDCIICYNKVPATHGAYMIAPCDHLFCKECLSQWLEIKSECPVCRASLPALEDYDD